MTSQRLVKLLACAAIVLAAAAIYPWWQTGEPAPAWLPQMAMTFAVAATAAALVGADTRPRVALRFLAALMALIAVVALAADWSAPAIDGARPPAKSLLAYLELFAPTLTAAIKSRVTNAVGATAWDPALTSVLGLPAWLLFAALAALAGLAGRPRRRVQIFIN